MIVQDNGTLDGSSSSIVVRTDDVAFIDWSAIVRKTGTSIGMRKFNEKFTE